MGEAMLKEKQETQRRLEAARQEIEALKEQLKVVSQEKIDARRIVNQLVSSVQNMGYVVGSIINCN